MWIAGNIRTAAIYPLIFGKLRDFMIHRYSYRLILVLGILISGCVERYYPEEEDLKTGTLVINAHITSKPGDQVIEISRSVGLTEPFFYPVSGSFAELIREDGEFREFGENRPGYYVITTNM